jgi:ABC-type amino acid transport substrate-binding protein
VRTIRRAVALAVPAVAGALLAACGLTIPTDPDGTLDRVRDEGVLRAGASPGPGWVTIADGRPGGREPTLVTGFAESLGAEVEWTVAGEEELVRLLEAGDLDLAVGGFTEDNAWVDKVGLTRAYTGTHVMMVPMGENAFHSRLELWLDDHGSTT